MIRRTLFLSATPGAVLCSRTLAEAPTYAYDLLRPSNPAELRIQSTSYVWTLDSVHHPREQLIFPSRAWIDHHLRRRDVHRYGGRCWFILACRHMSGTCGSASLALTLAKFTGRSCMRWCRGAAVREHKSCHKNRRGVAQVLGDINT